MNTSYSNASTPPRRTSRSTASGTSASRVDAMYDRQPQVSFVGSAHSEEEDDASVYSAFSPDRRRDANPPAQCWSCRQTQRLRSSLKRIEADYVSQIQSLQQQLQHATAQCAMVLQERDELLTSSDTAAAQHAIVEQEARALRAEVMQVMQERQVLRKQVQQWEAAARSTAHQQQQQQLRWCAGLLEEMEASVRAAMQSGEEEQRQLLQASHLAAVKAAEESAKAAAVTTPHRCHAAIGTAANGSTILSSTFSPGSSSPGASDCGKERRTCSPRPSQRRELSSQHTTHRPSFAGDSPRSASESAVVVSRTLQLSQCAEEAEERARRAEWRAEQQRSAYEMQLAEERALTADMQAELDDLIGNELTLLESEARCAIERDAAEALGAALTQQLQQCYSMLETIGANRAGGAAAEAFGASASPAGKADVLDLVEEGENASWRVEVTEMMSNMQQQLFQLLSAPSTARETQRQLAEVTTVVRAEAAEMKESLAALLDTSAQARVEGDTLREDLAECFNDIEERQSRQEAFLVAMSGNASRDSETTTELLRELRGQLDGQRRLSEQVGTVLQLLSTPSLRSPRADPPVNIAGQTKVTTPDVVAVKPVHRHHDPTAESMAAVSSSTPSSRRLSATSATPISEDQHASWLTCVSASTTAGPSSSPSALRGAAGEAPFQPPRIRVDAAAAAQQISGLLSSDSSPASDEDDLPSPYEEY